MRVIVLGLYTAALLLPPEAKKKITIEVDTEDKGALVKIPENLITLLAPPQLGAKHQLLKAVIEKPGLTAEAYARILGKDETTIRRHLQALAEQGLVELKGRPQKAYPTETAKTIA